MDEEGLQRLCRTLMTTMDGGVIVCRADGDVVMHDAESMRLLGEDRLRSVRGDGAEPAPRANPSRSLDETSVFDVLPEQVLQPVLQAVVGGGEETRSVVIRLTSTGTETNSSEARTSDAATWLHVQVHGIGDQEHALIQLQPQIRSPEPGSHEVLRGLIEGMRAPLASIRAAIETMTQYPTMDATAATQFAQIIREQAVALSQQLEDAVDAYAAVYRAAWSLETVTVEDLATVLEAPVQEATGMAVETSIHLDPSLRVEVDPIAVARLFAFLARRIVNATRCSALSVHLRSVRRSLAVDLAWDGPPVTTQRLRKWKDATLAWGDTIVEMSVREIADHHDAQVWTESDETGEHVRVLIPLVEKNHPV